MKKAKIRLAKLQGFMKMRIQMRKFIIMREQNVKYQQRKRIEAAKRKILLAKKKKESVKIIEKCRYRILHLRELRILRMYLRKLPFECRSVYFKFIDVKRTQNELVRSYMNYFGNND